MIAERYAPPVRAPIDVNALAHTAEAAKLAAWLQEHYPGNRDPDFDRFWRWFSATVASRMLTDSRDVLAALAPFKDHLNTQLSLEALRMWALCRWGDAGLPVFVPTQGLAAALTLTKYPRLTVGDVPWPFDAMVIQVPRPWLAPPFDKVSTIWAYRMPVFPDLPDMAGIRVEVVMEDGTCMDRSSPLSMDVEAAIESSAVRDVSEPMSVEELTIVRICTRMVIGLAVYVAALPPTERAAAQRKLGKIPRRGAPDIPQQWDLGREVKLPRELRQAAADFSQSRRNAVGKAGWKLARRFTVRGHFKRCVIGPRIEGRREWRWVKPYWKGPEEGIALRRQYAVEELPAA